MLMLAGGWTDEAVQRRLACLVFVFSSLASKTNCRHSAQVARACSRGAHKLVTSPLSVTFLFYYLSCVDVSADWSKLSPTCRHRIGYSGNVVYVTSGSRDSPILVAVATVFGRIHEDWCRPWLVRY